MALNTNTPNTELENMQPAEAVTADEQVATAPEQNDVTEPAEVEAPAAEETVEEPVEGTVEEAVEETVAEITIDKDGNVEVKGNDNYETTVTVSEDGSVEIVTEKLPEESEEGINIDFKPEEFVNNLGYMGKGMLGIFVVIGIIIASVYALAKIGGNKNKQ